MTVAKRIVILANSRKPPGRCVAGIELDGSRSSDWVRPVGDVSGAGLKPWQRRLSDGSEPLPLDVVDFALLRPVPVNCHSENWLVDANYPRNTVGTFRYEDLDQLVGDPDTLWSNEEETLLGINDLVAESELDDFDASILLLRPRGLVLSAHTNRWSEKQELRATFTHHGVIYKLKVTDPVYEDRYLTGDDGEFEVSNAYLTISLGEPWSKPGADQLYSSKLVAAVIEPRGAGV